MTRALQPSFFGYLPESRRVRAFFRYFQGWCSLVAQQHAVEIAVHVDWLGAAKTTQSTGGPPALADDYRIGLMDYQRGVELALLNVSRMEARIIEELTMAADWNTTDPWSQQVCWRRILGRPPESPPPPSRLPPPHPLTLFPSLTLAGGRAAEYARRALHHDARPPLAAGDQPPRHLPRQVGRDLAATARHALARRREARAGGRRARRRRGEPALVGGVLPPPARRDAGQVLRRRAPLRQADQARVHQEGVRLGRGSDTGEWRVRSHPLTPHIIPRLTGTRSSSTTSTRSSATTPPTPTPPTAARARRSSRARPRATSRRRRPPGRRARTTRGRRARAAAEHRAR